MSEFTDFHAVLTQAESLSALRGQLETSVAGAIVPLDELPYDALETTDAMEAAWAAVPKPIWIKLGIPWEEDVANLAKVGPAVRIKVEEDFSAWALCGQCGGHAVSIAMLDTTERYREATDMVPLYDADADLSGFSGCLGVAQDALKATLIVDGGQAFSALVGIKYEQMLDMQLEEIEAGEYTFGFAYD